MQMQIDINANKEMYQLIEKLFIEWESWNNKDFCVHSLLPELISHPNRGTKQEKMIIEKIKAIATKSANSGDVAHRIRSMPHSQERDNTG